MKNESLAGITLTARMATEDVVSFTHYVKFLASRADYLEVMDVEYYDDCIIMSDDCSSWAFLGGEDGRYHRVEYSGDLFGFQKGKLINCELLEQFGTWESV